MNQLILVSRTFAVTALLALSACSGSSSSPAPAASVQQETMTLTEVTDKSSCTGESPTWLTVNDVWYKHFKGTSAHFDTNIDMSIDLNSSSVATITNKCTMSNGKTLSATIQIPISITSGTVQFLAGDQKTVEDSSGGSTANCTVSAQKGAFQYSLVGTCLKAAMNGQTGYFTHN